MLAKPAFTDPPRPSRPPRGATASGSPRDCLGNRFVYAVVSSRARGLSIGLNLNPDKHCNFDCIYCEVNRDLPAAEHELDVPVMITELEKTLALAASTGLRDLPAFNRLNEDLLKLRHVALSGDGEPTLCPKFEEVVQAVTHVRARRAHPFFKLVLITNGSGLDLPAVQEGLRYFTSEDEIWIKLDAGTQNYMDRVNRGEASLVKVLDNIWLIAHRRPIIIQSLFPMIDGQEPDATEIDQFIQRLIELKDRGAMISLVQVYSATRPAAHPECGHIPLPALAQICRRIKAETGLKAEMF
jgi:wyosine [tRNA(Phe)-imidazoG37] synthetase (radical SAM superfamily)